MSYTAMTLLSQQQIGLSLFFSEAKLTLWLCFCSTCYLVAGQFHPNGNCTAGLRRRKSWWGRERAHVRMCDRDDITFAFSPSASPFCLLLIQVLGAKTEVTVGEWRNWKFWNTPEEVQADKSFFTSSHKRDGHCLLHFFTFFLSFLCFLFLYFITWTLVMHCVGPKRKKNVKEFLISFWCNMKNSAV